ncbi:hypothetical protein BD311DRAFT_716084 [Dichomitus squalens]|uniref:Uncharacterized protein n=1 Tax=Dichomitus squalens TaxID=114155 RepID=A0A4Q9MVK1_9APHY|nr:hypothetical protein BD311DRAFT_716084 [Dichomitus squalens]
MPRRLAIGQTLRGRYARREIMLRGHLRQAINAELGAARISGVSGAEMRWTLSAYLEHIFFKLGIKLIWPPGLLFANLSQHSGILRITRVKMLWESGVIRFAPVTDADRMAALQNPLSAAPGPLHHGLRKSYGRSDIKARRNCPKTNPLNLPYRYERHGPKSAKIVSARAEAAAEAEVREAREREAREREAGSDVDDIEPFSDDEEMRAADELMSDPIEEWE